jgi:hypothetical protein
VRAAIRGPVSASGRYHTAYVGDVLGQWPSVGTWGEWFAGLATAAAVFVAVRQNDSERAERREHDRRRIIRDVEEAIRFRVSLDNPPPERSTYEFSVGLENHGPRPFRDLIAKADLRFEGEVRSTEERLPLLPAGDTTSGFQFVFRDTPGPAVEDPTFTVRLTTTEGVVLERDAHGVYAIVSGFLSAPDGRAWRRRRS